MGSRNQSKNKGEFGGALVIPWFRFIFYGGSSGNFCIGHGSGG